MNLLIPIIAGIVGWATNWLAIKMTFYPLQFWGIKPILGWQGIIPANAGKVAGKSVDLMLGKLLKLEDQFEKIIPEKVAEKLAPLLQKKTRETINSTLTQQIPLLWKNAPTSMKEEMYKKAEEDTPKLITDVMEDLKININEILDIRQMVVDELTTRKQILNTIFQKCGETEFKFIERSGLYFGFLFGIVQMFIWIYWQQWWILPLGGLLVGYLTNWLALKLIFEPREPKKIGPFVLQGIFLKRQKEVAVEYAKIISSEILTSEKLFQRIVNGPNARRLFWLVQDHIEASVDKSTGYMRTFIQLTTGTKTYQLIKDRIGDEFSDLLPKVISNAYGYTEEALDMESTLREKMQQLTPQEFEGVLRPAYQEDEWKLILTGALLGLAAGIGQLFLLG